MLAACLIGAASPAHASEQFGDLDVSFVSLKVNDHGEALVTYRTARGIVRHVYVWGAINANAPSPSNPQVRFNYDYSGGLKRSGRQTWRTFADRCAPYDGPRLARLVNACKAPDGSYWALQRWQRMLPMRGIAPFRPEQSAFELHVSHWSGPLPVLEVSPNWTYGGRWQGLFGKLTYLGQPAYGYRTRQRASEMPTRGSSTSTRSTRCSVPAGGMTPARSRIAATERSVTASCRR